MNITIRTATPDDAADACSVIRSSIIECCADDHRGDAAVLQGWLRNKTPEFVRDLILAPAAFSVVAIVDEATVGFGSALGTGEVTLCYVTPSVRFTGAGKALLAALEAHAVRAGIGTLRLKSTRTARAFYLRNGFVLEGAPVLAFGMEGQPMRKELRSTIIVSLDFTSASEALELARRLGPPAQFYKVGLQLLTAAGPDVVRQLISDGKQVFLDLKLHEIPTSVAGAVTAAGALGVSMVTVHASAGSAAMRAAVEAARPYPGLKVLALTVITSMGDGDLGEIGVTATVREQVVRLAKLAAAAGCHGVVASAQEARLLRELLPAEMLIVTPGTQLETDAKNDQARVATPFDAVRWGASHIVIGRSISRSTHPSETFAVIQAQVNAAISS